MGNIFEQMIEKAVTQCRSKGRPFPYVIILTSANGGVEVARLANDGHPAEPLLKVDPPGDLAEAPFAVLVVDAEGDKWRFTFSEAGKLTIH